MGIIISYILHFSAWNTTSMQIGCCWFDSQRQEMIDQSRGKVWQLSDDECYVLQRLMKNKDKVVSKQKLLRGLSDHINAELALVDIIYNIRTFLGQDNAPLIETVADQGYLLHSKLKLTSKSLVGSPFHSMSVLVYSIFTSIILVLMFWIYSEVDHPYYIDTYFEQTVYTQSHQAIDFELYPASKKQKKALSNKVNHLLSTLKHCKSSPWNVISLAISSDDRLINLILMNNENAKPDFKNIKITSPDLDFSFINEQWLVEAGICDK